ncbi:MAG: hypothetical protein J5659_02150 [Clostridia bacterium]|nr:hypothetical protein [Clostridia bacterium]
MKKYFKLALIVFLSATIFFISSYLYLFTSLKGAQKTADKKTDDIPYYENQESCGIMFLFPSGNRMLFFLDFDEEILYIINIYDDYGESDNYVGYSVDYTCEIDYYTLSMLFDRLGGIDLSVDDGTYRLSGIQICDLLCSNESDDFYYEVICAVCSRISDTGLNNDDFLFIVSNCNTDLTMPVCLYWSKYVKHLFTNAVFVNRGN